MLQHSDIPRKRITFNVGGKRYETTPATIEMFPNSLLAMLVRRHLEPEIFIDRDGELFRWVLYWYQTQILVDHKTVRVPIEVWENELQFYGIGQEEMTISDELGGQAIGEMSPTKRKFVEAEQKLQEKVAKTIKEDSVKESKDRDSRREWYGKILDYIMDRHKATGESTFQFIDNYNSGQHLDPRAAFNPPWLDYWFDREFRPYCSALGITVTHVFNGNTVKKKYEWEPAKNLSITRKHKMIQITIKTQK